MPGRRRLGQRRGQLLDEAGEHVERAGLGRLPLLGPATYLAGQETVRATELAESHRVVVDLVQCDEGVDEQLAGDGRLVAAQSVEHVGLVQDDALDEVHEVERRAQHVRVGAQRDGRRYGHRDLSRCQRVDDGEFADHVVRRRQHVCERRPAQRPRRGAVGDAVGQVGLAAGDDRTLELTLPQPRLRSVQPGGQGGEVDTGEISHSTDPRDRPVGRSRGPDQDVVVSVFDSSRSDSGSSGSSGSAGSPRSAG